MRIIHPRNLYYLLAYAFRIKPSLDMHCEGEEFDNHLNVLAAMLVHCMEPVSRKGLIRNYSDHSELTARPHGRIDVSKSIRKGTLKEGKLFCDYELYDSNTYQNRVIRSVVESMLNSDGIHRQMRANLRAIDNSMRDIQPIPLDSVHRNLLVCPERDKDYRTALRVCGLYMDCLLPSNGNGQVARDFLNDSQEHKLFEDFVRGYFEIEHSGIFRSRKQLDWAKTGDCSKHLPGMEMDILLKNGNKTLIIDTKCYGAILTGKNGFQGLNSPNLYQMNAYLQNWQYANPNDDVSGMLLYAKTEEDFESCDNHVLGHAIHIRTLDCNQSWPSISSCLDDIAKLLE